MKALLPTHLDAPRSNMLMRSGRLVNLFDPSLLDIILSDWVTGISRVPRWGGQTKGEIGYNVLQHSSLTEKILTRIVWPDAPREARLLAKAHDLHEGGGLGDVVSPYGAVFKPAGIDEIKARLDHVIFPHIGIPLPIPKEHAEAVHLADRVAAVSEAVHLMDWPENSARRDIGKGYRGKIWEDPIIILDERQAREEWWRLFNLLGGGKK